MTKFRFALVALAFSLPLAARADTLFQLMDVTTSDGGTVTGTVSVTTAGQIFATDMTYTSSKGTFTFTGSGTNQQSYDGNQFYIDDFNSSAGSFEIAGGASLTFLLDSPSLGGGFSGSPFCSFVQVCDNETAGFDVQQGNSYVTVAFATGSLGDGTPIVAPPPPSAVPEPSSLALLGTGVLGVVGGLRRRLRG